MSGQASTRRDFLRTSSALAATAVAASSLVGIGSARAQAPTVERRQFGNTDMKVALLGFGGAEIGYDGVPQDTVTKLLNTAIDSGLNVIDTAECYANSEDLIGEAVSKRRDDYYLFTKCGHAPGADGWSKQAVLKSIERSLKLLKTDHVDLVNLHSCSLDELMKGDCIEGLQQAQKEGKTRYIGYSGDSQAALYAVNCGHFNALQTSLSFCDQEPIDLTLPVAVEKGMGVICKRPIANAVWRYSEKPGNAYHVEYWNRLQQLKYDFAMGEAAKRTDADGPAGVALRFTAMQPGVSVMIVGTTNPARFAQNAELLAAGPLSDDLVATIRSRWAEVSQGNWSGQT